MKKIGMAFAAIAFIGWLTLPFDAAAKNNGNGNGNGGDNGRGNGNSNGASGNANSNANTAASEGNMNGVDPNNLGQAISIWAKQGVVGMHAGGRGNSDGDPTNGTAHGDGADHRSGRVQSYLDQHFNIGSNKN